MTIVDKEHGNDNNCNGESNGKEHGSRDYVVVDREVYEPDDYSIPGTSPRTVSIDHSIIPKHFKNTRLCN